MSDLFTYANQTRDGGSGDSEKPLSITELTRKIKGTLESGFGAVWVKGEISNFKPYPSSGHLYFSLKDEGATLACAAFGFAKNPAAKALADGVLVLCHGRISVYPPRGGYQLQVDHIEPVGSGALQAEFEKRKAKLAAEGLFDPARKKKLPAFPSRIALITSPSGAAVKDFIRILGRRAPQSKVLIIPSLTQGKEACSQLIAGLRYSVQWKLGDVIVLARGGGSIEDLWCFNDEMLVREIAASPIPVVSAIGHEIDFTLSDFAADLRAATPSAAAELISEEWMRGAERMDELSHRLALSTRRKLRSTQDLLRTLSAKLVNPRDRLRVQAQLLDETTARLQRAAQTRMEALRARFDRALAELRALSPLAVLDRGYAIVSKIGKKGPLIVRSALEGAAGEKVQIRFADGERGAALLDSGGDKG